VHIGRSDVAEHEYGGAALGEWGILDLAGSAAGMADVADRALARVTNTGRRFWVHFDVDVLDPELMPAVDSPLPGGLDSSRAAELLGALLAHPAALGLQVTIYDPTLDPDGAAGRRLVDLLEHAFTTA
jgi:arginase